MKQSEREKIYDDILIYLRDNKGSRSVEAILRGTDEFYSERREIMKELVHKKLVDATEQTLSKGNFLGTEITETRYDYRLSIEGRELVRKGGFKKNRRLKLFSTTKENILFLTAVILFVGNVFQFFTSNREVLQTQEQKQEINLNSTSDTTSVQ